MKVANILKTKGHDVMTVRPSETIAQLAQRLRFERVGAMIVSQDGSTIDGIISERDVAYGFAEHQSALSALPVADLMTKSVVTCSPDENVSDIARIMTQQRIRHLPVQDNGKLVGIISVGDVVKHRLDELQLETNVLRDYAIAAR